MNEIGEIHEIQDYPTDWTDTDGSSDSDLESVLSESSDTSIESGISRASQMVPRVRNPNYYGSGGDGVFHFSQNISLNFNNPIRLRAERPTGRTRESPTDLSIWEPVYDLPLAYTNNRIIGHSRNTFSHATTFEREQERVFTELFVTNLIPYLYGDRPPRETPPWRTREESASMPHELFERAGLPLLPGSHQLLRFDDEPRRYPIPEEGFGWFHSLIQDTPSVHRAFPDESTESESVIQEDTPKRPLVDSVSYQMVDRAMRQPRGRKRVTKRPKERPRRYLKMLR